MLFAEWRLVLTGPADGYVNMAIDEATLVLVSEQRVPPTLRIYEWDTPCCTVGYLQRVASLEASPQRCDLLWVRRLTGGQTCIHGGDLSYSLIVSLEDTLIPSNIPASYERISAGVIEGLRLLGVDARFAPPAEVQAEGQVVATAAQARRLGVLLHQGTIALEPCEIDGDLDVSCRALTPLSQVLGDRIDMDDASDALTMGFRRALGVDLGRSVLFAKEKRLARELLRGRYMRPEWTLGKRVNHPSELARKRTSNWPHLHES